MLPKLSCATLLVCLASPSAALNVAVAGATGRVDRLVVRAAQHEGHAVIALVLNVAKASAVVVTAVTANARMHTARTHTRARARTHARTHARAARPNAHTGGGGAPSRRRSAHTRL